MKERFNAFQFVGEFCLMRKCDEKEYGIVKIHEYKNEVIKYSEVSTVYHAFEKEKEQNYITSSKMQFIDESFVVIKPLI